jgi:spermidine/putrescine-binding protein
MTIQMQFANWMANTVKSIHYSDNEQMERAFERLRKMKNNLKIYLQKFADIKYLRIFVV